MEGTTECDDRPMTVDDIKGWVRTLSLSLWRYKDYLNRTESNPMRDLIWEDLTEEVNRKHIRDIIDFMDLEI